MLPAEIENALSIIEMECEAVAAAVASGEPQTLERASMVLRQAAVDFAAFLERQGDARLNGDELRMRLKKVTGLMNIQRENLIRRSVLVERALNAMVPSTRKNTYAPAGRTGGYGSFGA